MHFPARSAPDTPAVQHAVALASEAGDVHLTMTLPWRAVDAFGLTATGFGLTTEERVPPGAMGYFELAVDHQDVLAMRAIAVFSRRCNTTPYYRSTWEFEMAGPTAQRLGRLIEGIESVPGHVAALAFPRREAVNASGL